MRKRIKGLFIFCIIIFGVLLTGCKTQSIDEKENIEIANVDQIFIDVSSTDLNIIPEDREDVKVHLHGKKAGNLKHKLSMNLDDNTLQIEVKIKPGINIGYATLKLDVYIPRNYENILKIDGSSGDVNIEDMNLSKLSIYLSSGDTNIKNLDVENFKHKVSSGDTNIKNLNIKEFEYKAHSGDLEGNNVNTESLHYNTSSGEVKLENFEGVVEGVSTSGDIMIVYEKFNNNIDLKASSGSIIVNLPEDAEFYIDSRVSSGNINCKFPIEIESEKDKELIGTVISNKNNIKIKTISGDIDIR